MLTLVWGVIKRYFPPPNGATDIPISLFWGREHLPEWSRLWSGWGQSCRRIRAPRFPGLEQVHSILKAEPKFFTWVQPGPGQPLWSSLRLTLPSFHSHLYGRLLGLTSSLCLMLCTGTGTLKSTCKQARAVQLWLVLQGGKAGAQGTECPCRLKEVWSRGTGQLWKERKDPGMSSFHPASPLCRPAQRALHRGILTLIGWENANCR